ncbi:MAG: 50S ribosomal protein L4 [Brevundimonas subvibrioides]|uniref:Large ribosomal subunit protein uL4 n=1 Tax=Brevundimonas subvibrioides TaxID=74313 RepID=A0A258HBZ9_9CAUL|nr:50S ribosomal protein L4 [Brevundimonas subvibrioides]OYX54530.1 MAG: 50S ribosomal protein L4 [Brevundimonas subvibrioides]
MKLSSINLDGKALGDVELSDAVFGITDIRGDLLARYVNWQLAKRRAGTHKVQTRNENSRTGKKMYKQKGTGGARHGSRRAPQFVGGSRAFGPIVRDHGFDLPKKVRALALRHALSSKAKSGDLIVVDALTVKDAKTAALRETFGKLGWTRTLIIAGPEVDANFALASRNIPQIHVLPNAGLNVYDILRADKLVLSKAAVEAIEARYADFKPSRREQAEKDAA